MNNKEFKNKNLSDVLQSGIKIYTNMDKDVQKTLQDRIDNGNYYKMKTNVLVLQFLIVRLVA